RAGAAPRGFAAGAGSRDRVAPRRDSRLRPDQGTERRAYQATGAGEARATEARRRTRMTDTAPVRAGEEIDADSLGRYLGEPVEVEQFPGGHSNLTYLVRTPAHEYVLRRAPLGPVAPRAHDMVREFAILKSIHPHFPPAPGVYRCCEDASVIGAVFYLMERRR